MAEEGNTLIVIPARGGSKRLPRKNVLPLAGKPLICWTIEAAFEARLNARIMVTSDDEEILDVARKYESQGLVAYKRPAVLASDTASTADVLIDAINAMQLNGYKVQTIILLQPTSPLRMSGDIHASLDAFRQGGCQDTVVSVCEVDHPTAWIGTIDADSRLEGVDLSGKRSQDHKNEYRLNGAVYVASAEYLINKGGFFTDRLLTSVMPRLRSIDIDEYADFLLCELIIKNSSLL